MNRRSFYFLVMVKALIFLMLFSCEEKTNISTYTVSYGNFTNSIVIDGFVEPVKSTSINTPRSGGGVIQFLVEDGEQVEEGQVVCIIENQQMQSQYENLTTSLERAEVGIVKSRADLAMQYAILEAQVRTNEADTKIAQMDSLQISFMSRGQRMIKELELEKATIEKNRYEKKLEALKVIQQSEIKRLELEIQRFKTNVQSVKERLDELTLKAPHSGIVVISDNFRTGGKLKVGDDVYGNFPVATLPEFKLMKVKIMAPEADFKIISVNDSVTFTFDAMPGNVGKGKILKKSPMASQNSNMIFVSGGAVMIGDYGSRASSIKFFEIEASLDSVDVIPDPGFSAKCMILLKQVDSVLSVPQIALFEEDSMKVVFVKQKRGYEKRQVLTDMSSLKEAVVSAGLQEGEVVTLSKPKLSMVKEWNALPDSLTIKPETPVDTLQKDNMPNLPPGMNPNMLQRIVQP